MILFQLRSTKSMTYISIKNRTQIGHSTPFMAHIFWNFRGKIHATIFEIYSCCSAEHFVSFCICLPSDRPSSWKNFLIELLIHPILQPRDAVFVSRRLLQLGKDFIKFVIHLGDVFDFMICRTYKITQILVGCKV